MKNKQKTGNWLLAFLAGAAFLFLVCHFFNNMWQINPRDSLYRGWQLDSEQLVVDKIMDARSNGIGNYNGMMLDYQQQIGFAGIFFSVVDKLVDHGAGLIDPIPKDIMCGINVVIFTILVFVILYWLYKEFGLWTAGVTYVTILFTNWLGFSTKNIYWMTWTMLLPMAALLVLFLLEEKRGKTWNLWLFFLSFATIFLRSACGYEFISCVMVALELPVIYFAVKHAWGWKKYIQRAVCAGVGALGGFLSAIFVNIALMAGLHGWKEAVDYLIFVSAKRTGYATLEGFDKDVLWAFGIPLPEVFQLYLEGKEDIPVFGIWNLATLMAVFFGVALLAVLVLILRKRKQSLQCVEKTAKCRKIWPEAERKQLGLTLMMTVSVLGPFSWLVLAKGHSVHHPHINYIIFSLPFTMLGFASAAQNLQSLCRTLWAKGKDTKEKV